MRDFVAECMGVRVTEDLGRYLGFPSVLGKNKTAIFRFIEQRVRERIGGWQQKLISKAGREVLIKSIAHSLPIFTMSVYLLPGHTCNAIEKTLNRYWWSGGDRQKGIHGLSWSRLSAPKTCGGLGFKKIREFNIALLAKQGWRLLTTPSSLVGRLLKAKYFPSCDFLDAQIGNNPSYIWRRVTELYDATVSSLLDEQGKWDLEILHDLFKPEDVPRILATPISLALSDSWRWRRDIRGVYTVKHGYQLLTNQRMDVGQTAAFSAWDKLWKLPVSPKVKNFLWRCARNIVPVREVLKQRHVWIGGGLRFMR
ncbi:uncharacterized protein LOC116005896 [Ipomoea triloba]|uniref:uncharacterized protein LOC116005896 n=1 Tax=Ipomoea triloba TaxID=35885 RepID=UPI00125CE490|nr:uncharacterized protein LOC116005896 [Ipomoea triloba]